MIQKNVGSEYIIPIRYVTGQTSCNMEDSVFSAGYRRNSEAISRIFKPIKEIVRLEMQSQMPWQTITVFKLSRHSLRRLCGDKMIKNFGLAKDHTVRFTVDAFPWMKISPRKQLVDPSDRYEKGFVSGDEAM